MSAPTGRDAPGVRALVLVVLLATIWSSSFVFIKVAVAEIPPLTMASARTAIAGAMLVIALVAFGREPVRLTIRAWAVFAVAGLVGNVFPFALIAFGEQSVDAGLAAVLMGGMPLVTAVLAHFFAAEPLTARRVAGVLVGFAGILVLVGSQALTGLGTTVLAQAAVFSGGVCYALSTVYVRRFADQPDRVLAAGATLTGSVAMLPFALAIERPWTLEPSLAALGCVAYLGFVATGFAALLYFNVIRTAGATYFSQVNFVLPAMGVLWGVLLLGERPDARTFAALGLIAAGVVLVSTRGRRRS